MSDYSEQHLKVLQFAVSETLAYNQKITVDILRTDWGFLQVKAMEEGISDQIFIASVLHKYVTGKLVEKS